MNQDYLLPNHFLTGNEVYYIRLSLKLNQKQFGDLMGINIGTISQWEANQDGIIQARYPVQCMIKLLYADYLIKDDAKFREIVKNLFSKRKYIS